MNGGRWGIAARVDHPDPDEANRLALADLDGGADTLTLVSAGAPGAHGFGLYLDTPEALDRILASVALDHIETRLDPGPECFADGDRLIALLDRRGHDLGALQLDLGLDPVGSLAHTGVSAADRPIEAARLARVVADLAGRGFAGPILRADGRLWNAAGASAAQELGAVLGTGLLYLRTLEAGGLPLTQARAALSFALAAETDLVRTVAKFRALRRLWARLEDSCGLDVAPIRLHAETAWRQMSAVSPHTNIIRSAIACFAAAIGGADSILVLPHTLPLGLPDAGARRLARNTQHVLAEESHLWRVDDPAAGAPAFESVTETLCEEAWAALQQLEREGGIIESLGSGLVQGRVAEARLAGERRLCDAEDVLVGVTLFRDDAEPPVAVLRPAPASSDDGLPPNRAPAERLRPRRLSEAFEPNREDR